MKKLIVGSILILASGFAQADSKDQFAVGVIAKEYCVPFAELSAKKVLQAEANSQCPSHKAIMVSPLRIIASGNTSCWMMADQGAAVAAATASFQCEPNPDPLSCYNDCIEGDGDFPTCHDQCGMW